MSDDVIPKEIARALEVLGLTLPVTTEDLERAKRVQLYTWNPARYSNLTNNPKKIVGLEGYGLTVVERVAIETHPHAKNIHYLKVKKSKMGHMLEKV